jgi:LCP family protein required for cell wall assembly
VSVNATANSARVRRLSFQWWWLIWLGAGLCVFLCGLLLGLASGQSAPGEGHWLLRFFAPPFGGRDRVSILALGVDNSEGRGLADTIIAVSVWPETGEMSALAIPRDSRVYVPGVGVRRVNEAHSFGGLPLTLDTVELLLGLPFDYYMEVDVPGLAGLLDAVGGIDLEVEKRMYYRDRAGGLTIDLQPGFQHLDGQSAVGYVRFRHDARGDLGRIDRQRKFIRAALRQLFSSRNMPRIRELARTFVDTVNTNLTVQDMLALKKIVEQTDVEAIRMATLPGAPRLIDGASMLELDADQVQHAVDRILWGQGTSLVLLNGTTVGGLAARTAERLEERGYEVLEVGNAEERTATTLILDHRANARRAARVADVLGVGSVSAAPDGSNPADVTVILGEDSVRARR